MSRGAPPLSIDETLGDALRDVFERAGFDYQGIRTKIGFAETVTVNAITEPRLRRHTDGGTPLETFIRLFFMRIPVPRAAADVAFAPITTERLIEAGVLAAAQDDVVSWIQISADEGLRLAFDPPSAMRDMDADHVMGIAPSSGEVRNIGPARAGKVADLGTGCGGLALVWAKRAEQVIATDINPRAVAMARLNQRLNGATNVDVRLGSLFEPLGPPAASFDLITMNPPFVISGGEQRLTFRDGGMQGDGFVQAVIAGAPPYLAPGGTLRMTVAWACIRGQRWQDRVQSWIPPGHDAWVATRIRQSSATYIESWINESEGLQGEAYERRFNTWLADFEAAGIEAVGTGVMVMRKRAAGGEPWFVAYEDVEGGDGTAGELVDRLIAGRDFLERCSEVDILDTGFQIAPDAKLIQEFSSEGDGWRPDSSVIMMTRGFRYRINLDARVAGLLAFCNGNRPLRELAAELATSLGAPADAINTPVAGAVRRLVEFGFLLPPQDA